MGELRGWAFVCIFSVATLAGAEPAADFAMPKLKPASELTVRYQPETDSKVKVEVVGENVDGQPQCKFKLDNPLFKVKAKWNPLPLVVVTPVAGDENAKVAAEFENHLDFLDGTKEWNDKEISFVVQFKKDEFIFESYWKITPVLREEKTGSVCAAKTVVCPHSKLVKDEKGKYSCKEQGAWSWINRLTAVPNLYLYSTQGKRVISNLVAGYVKQREDGGLSTKEAAIE